MAGLCGEVPPVLESAADYGRYAVPPQPLFRSPPRQSVPAAAPPRQSTPPAFSEETYKYTYTIGYKFLVLLEVQASLLKEFMRRSPEANAKALEEFRRRDHIEKIASLKTILGICFFFPRVAFWWTASLFTFCGSGEGPVQRSRGGAAGTLGQSQLPVRPNQLQRSPSLFG